MRNAITRRARLILPATMLAALLGCSGGQFGGDLSVHPRPRQFTKPSETTVRLPQDEPFNIHLHNVSKQSSLEGTVEVDASAAADGTAHATAAVTRGGSAQAVFQLGHAISNTTDRQMDVEFRVKFQHTFEAKASEAERMPDATVGLRLYAQPERGLPLRNFVKITYTTENGSTNRGASDSLDFTLTLGPGDKVEVYLAGQAKVDAPNERSASCSLTLSDVAFEIITRPAPPVRTAAHVAR